MRRSADAVKQRLISLEAAMTILKLSASIYPIGSWQHPLLVSEGSTDDVLESWSLRSTLASWSWRAIEELRGDDDNREFCGVSFDLLK